MRAAFVTTDVLQGSNGAAGHLRRLDEAGLSPLILKSHAADPPGDDLGFEMVSCPPADIFCRDDLPDLLVHAASAADVHLSETFLVCRERDDLALATAAGCRPVLVLGERSIDDVLGPIEPDEKDFIAATDLPTAVGYMLEEAAQDESLGLFPYGAHHTLDDRPAGPALTRGDLNRVLAVVVVGGVAIALGIAYLLQEIYQTITLPPIAFWLTLQFIPQTLRGILFIVIGVAATLVAQRVLNSIPGRSRSH